MKFESTLIAALFTLVFSGDFSSARAQAAAPAASGTQQKVAGETVAGESAEGEVRKIDKENKKITLRHGEIKTLEMPAMTMVFQVRDPGMLERVKAGDKIVFKAEKVGGAMVVTEIQVAR